MSPQIKAIPLILVGVLLNAAAQICLKKGLAHGMEMNLSALIRLVFTPWILAGLGCYAVSVVVWMKALSMVDVNYAYPFLALGFLANALMAKYFLREDIPSMRWVALTIIIVGVALQALSGETTN
jgi:drug/metabolite transporter (DMT)-like permease